ncbi:DUF4268 domain-containing protein [Halovulum sp. GXIMD14794]
MIRMAEKDSEEKSAKGALRTRHEIRLAFWEQLLPQLREAGCERWQNISPTKENWLVSATGVSGCSINICIVRDEVRVDLALMRSDASENKWLFDRLSEAREEIQSKVQADLDWRRLDHRKLSLVSCRYAVQAHSKENWPEINAWLVDHYQRMDRAFSERVRALSAQMKPGGGA